MKLKTLLAGAGTAIVLTGGYFGWREARSQWVDAGYVGILYDASGGVQKDFIPPRRVFVGFRQRLYTYPTKLQSAKYIQSADEGETKAADGVLISTSENANTTFDVTVIYRVEPKNALRVFQAFGPTDIQTIQSTHIRRAVKDTVNEIGPRYDVFELMGTKRLEFSKAATESLAKRMAPNGITVDSVFLQQAYPTPETQEKIVRRINQYTEYEIALLKQKIAEVQRQSNVITATARTQATRTVSATAKEKGLDQLQLQADEEAIEKWDGRLPAVRMGGGQTMVLDGALLSSLSARRQAAPPAPRAATNENTPTEGDGGQ